jgi:CRISPR-associated protein Cas2
MYLLVAYDVVKDRRRRKLQKGVEGWLHGVQKSVFEGFLKPNDLPKLLRAVADHIDPATDSLRVYPLCETCRRSGRLYGVAEPVPDPETPVFL